MAATTTDYSVDTASETACSVPCAPIKSAPVTRQGMAVVLHIALALFVAGVSVSRAQSPKKPDSVYTNLSGNSCASVRPNAESGSRAEECPGIGGYKLHVLNDDNRSSITVISPDTKAFPLEYWNVVAGGFSSLGDRAEWRVLRGGGQVTPVALIVRVNYTDQSNPAGPRKRSVLAVAKLTPGQICVVRTISNGASGNEEARRVADRAAAEP